MGAVTTCSTTCSGRAWPYDDLARSIIAASAKSNYVVAAVNPNFHLEFAPDLSMPLQGVPGTRGGDPGNAADPANPAVPADPDHLRLFVALQEQIGLKLSSDKGPVSFLVIDHVEKPTAN